MRHDIFARLIARGTTRAKFIEDRRLLVEAHAALVEATAHIRELVDFCDTNGHSLGKEPMKSAVNAVSLTGLVSESETMPRACLELLAQKTLLQMHDDIHRIMEARSLDMKARHRALKSHPTHEVTLDER